MFSKNREIKPEVVIISTHTMGYGVIRSLGPLGIPITALFYNKSDIGFLSRYVKHRIKIPNPAKKREEFINSLITIGKSKNFPLLIPANDECLVPVSESKPILEKYYIVASPDCATVMKYISKDNTYSIAAEIGIPIPKTFNPISISQLENIAQQIDFPCLVKPTQSHLYFRNFDKKMVMVRNFMEMKAEFKKAINSKLDCVIQEYIPGDETKGYNFNSYRYSDGSMVNFTAQKIRYSDKGLGIPTCVVSSEEIPEMRILATKLLDSLNYTGFSCMEFKLDFRDNQFKLMELNGRHNRSSLLALKSGINFPFIEYSDLMLRKKAVITNYKKNIYWIDFLKDIQTLPEKLHNKKYSVKEFILPYFKEKVFSDISLNDIFPTMKRFFDILPVSMIIFYKTIRHLIKGNQNK